TDSAICYSQQNGGDHAPVSSKPCPENTTRELYRPLSELHYSDLGGFFHMSMCGCDFKITSVVFTPRIAAITQSEPD
ncbi:hypothetical protein PQU94_17750, partial [Asticcacaulis sp. DXS10W]